MSLAFVMEGGGGGGGGGGVVSEGVFSGRRMGNVLDGAHGDLDERVDERAQRALGAAAFCFGVAVARAREDERPEVDAVHVLPVVYLPKGIFRLHLHTIS